MLELLADLLVLLDAVNPELSCFLFSKAKHQGRGLDSSGWLRAFKLLVYVLQMLVVLNYLHGFDPFHLLDFLIGVFALFYLLVDADSILSIDVYLFVLSLLFWGHLSIIKVLQLNLCLLGPLDLRFLFSHLVVLVVKSHHVPHWVLLCRYGRSLRGWLQQPGPLIVDHCRLQLQLFRLFEHYWLVALVGDAVLEA